MADVIGKCDGRIVCALNQRRLDELANGETLAGPQVHGRLADRSRGRTHTHAVAPLHMIQGDDHRHQLRDARDRHARPSSVLCEHFAGRRVLDDERTRHNLRRSRCCRLCRGDEGERRKESGDPDPEDHEREG